MAACRREGRWWPRGRDGIAKDFSMARCDTDTATMCKGSWLSLIFDTGGEVFERLQVAAGERPWRPKCCLAGALQPTSAIVSELAGPESACSGDSPAVSHLVNRPPGYARRSPREPRMRPTVLPGAPNEVHFGPLMPPGSRQIPPSRRDALALTKNEGEPAVGTHSVSISVSNCSPYRYGPRGDPPSGPPPPSCVGE